MKYSVSRIPLRAVLSTLPALLSLLISAATTSTLYADVIVTTPANPIHLRTVALVDTPLDVDGDGSTDFIFAHRPSWQMILEPATGGRIIHAPEYHFYRFNGLSYVGPVPHTGSSGSSATPLPCQFQIGPILPLSGIHWGGTTIIAGISPYWPPLYVSGHFHGLAGYIGIEFPIHDRPHYGWIRFDHFDINPGGSILEWGFESAPGVPIRTPNKPILVPMAAPKLARPGYLRLRWDAYAGMAYQVQAKPRLDAPTWTDVHFVIPITSFYTTLDVPITSPTQFFRVILPAIPVPLPSYPCSLEQVGDTEPPFQLFPAK